MPNDSTLSWPCAAEECNNIIELPWYAARIHSINHSLQYQSCLPKRFRTRYPCVQPPRSAIPKFQCLHKINVIHVGTVFGKSCWSRIEHQLARSNRFCAMLANGSRVDAIILRNFGNNFRRRRRRYLAPLNSTHCHVQHKPSCLLFVKRIGGECLNMKRALTFRIFLMNRARQVLDVNFWGSILRYCSRLPFGITTVERFWCCRAMRNGWGVNVTTILAPKNGKGERWLPANDGNHQWVRRKSSSLRIYPWFRNWKLSTRAMATCN